MIANKDSQFRLRSQLRSVLENCVKLIHIRNKNLRHFEFLFSYE